MSKEVFEDMQPGAAGGAKAKLEKQARQLAYDTKYKVKQALSAKSGGKADPAAVAKMYLAQLAKSPAPPAVKALAKKKLMGEEYVDVKGFVIDSVTDALLKVFVEKVEETTEEVIDEGKGETKFHIKVTDKKTGNTYHRYATRAKISELRANPNIATVEMSHQGESGTKAKKDYDRDGKVESSSKEHAGAVHNAIQKAKGGTPDGQDTRKEEVEQVAEADSLAAMAARREKRLKAQRKREGMTGAGHDFGHDHGISDAERKKRQNKEFDAFIGRGKKTKKEEVEISEVEISEEEKRIGGGNLKKLSKKATKRIDADVDGDVDTDDMNSSEMGEFVPSPDGKKKIKTKVQKESYSDWKNELFETKGENEDEMDQEVDVMKGKNKVKVMPELGESAKVCEKCGKSPCECDKEDPRGMKTKVNLMRNKLRAMGLKMSHELEGDNLQEKPGDGYLGPTMKVGGSEVGVPNPIRIAKDAADNTNRANQRTVDAVKAHGGTASMPPYKLHNKQTSKASQTLFGMQKQSYEPEGETIEEMRGQKQVDPRNQSREDKEEKKKTSEIVGNMKKVTTKKRMLDKQKFELQKKGKLPLNMSTEIEGDQLDELAPLAGLAIKAGLAAGTAVVGKMVYDKGKKVADKVKQQNQQKVDMINNIRNSYEAEGETVSEEDADRMKDRRMERGGVDGNVDYRRPPAAPNLAGKKKPKKGGPSAMDIVKSQIRAKYGDKAIVDTKKKKD